MTTLFWTALALLAVTVAVLTWGTWYNRRRREQRMADLAERARDRWQHVGKRDSFRGVSR